MIKERRFNLSAQLNILFTIITLFTSLLFIIIFRQTTKSMITTQANRFHEDYHNQVMNSFENGITPSSNENFVIMEIRINNISQRGIDYTIINSNTSYDIYINNDEIAEVLDEFIILNQIKTKKELNYNDKHIIGTVHPDNKNVLVLTVASSTYRERLSEPISQILIIGFISIIILGNGIILIWSTITVDKIKLLENQVSTLSSKEYKEIVTLDGSDELSDLANAINQMRVEILENERVKQEILQNVSHDIKTPIAVIQSYAEAIMDGISDPNEAEIILRQTEILKRQANQLLEWNKLEFIKKKEEFVLINIKDIIINVVNNHKYHNEVNFKLDLDDSKYLGVSENYYSVFNNLVDNALRYAETIIEITLKDKKLTFYNDGEHIDESFIDRVFKPYEKGHKGNFGLGMTIVQKTLTNFNMKLTIENRDKGVAFIIEPE